MKDILLAIAFIILAAIAAAFDDTYEVRKPDPSHIPPYINHHQP